MTYTKLNQEDINKTRRSTASNEIEEILKTLPKENSKNTLEEFIAECYQTFKEELTPNNSITETQGTLPKS